MAERGRETNAWNSPFFMMLKLLVKLLFSIGTVCGAVNSIDDYRLSTNTQPNTYDLWLNVELKELQIIGEVTINLFVNQRSNFIELNCVDLTIDEATVKLEQNGVPLQFTALHMNTTTEKCRLEFSQELVQLMNAALTLTFTGRIRTDLKGLYSTSYYVGSERRILAATQFQATYARMVFPCYDEPALKAIFKIRISHDPAMTALSNMPQTSRNVAGVLATTTFQDTPMMSTFILAFIVSDFKSVDSTDGRIRVFAPEHELPQAQHALSFSQRSLKFLEDYIGTPFTLPKLDLVALPELRFGGMENWGLIAFRKDVLLYDASKSPVRTQQTISTLISHELIHMWFGNFVTPEWWEYLWLSEGFAEYFEMYVTSYLEPSWRVLDQFNLIAHSALGQDGYDNVRAMTRELITPDEINGSFDYAVYAKSAAVIRMLQSAFGKDDFKAAMGNYIRSRLYGTTNPSFWFNELQRNVLVLLPGTVNAIFESWSTQPGYPVIQANRNYVDSKVTISQTRFYVDGTQNTVEKYFVPITWTDASSPNYEYNPSSVMWLAPTAKELVLNVGKKDSWILLNKLQHGFYRVNYDYENWNLLIHALHGPNYTDIHHLNRAGLVDDALNLARGGYITQDIAMDVLFYLKQETDFIPWSAAYNALTFLFRVFRGNPKFENLEAFVRNITSLSYTQTGFWTMKGDHVTELHRPNILYLACYVNLGDCVATSQQVVTQMLEDPLYVLPEHLQPVVFCAVAKNDNQLLDRLLAQLLQLVSGNPANIDKRYMYRLIGGMGCSTNIEVLNNALTLSLTPVLPGFTINIDGRDRQEIFQAVISGSTVGTKLALELMRTRYLDFSQRYNSMESIFRNMAPYLVTEELRTLFDRVVADNQNRIQGERVWKAIEQTQQDALNFKKWASVHIAQIEQWLERNNFNVTDGGGNGGGDGDGAATIFQKSWLLLVLMLIAMFKLQV